MKSHDAKKFPHLERILPPSHAIVRENKISIHPEKFIQWLREEINPNHSNFQQLINTMEKIRMAVQSNLGLSAIVRDKHESNHPIWIKKGEPHFPDVQYGKIKSENILYCSLKNTSKSAPKVQIMKDDSDSEELSILFQTKFRSFSLHIQKNGKVTSSLTLNWEAIYEDLAPFKEGEIEPLRSFTPWQRHSEANFFNGRSTAKILTYFTKTYPEVFVYNEKSYYQDASSQILHLNDTYQYQAVMGLSSNIYLTLDASFFEWKEKSSDAIMLAVIRKKSPLLGNIFQLAPALFRDEKIHIVFHGHQDETEIQRIIYCDFNREKCETIPLKKPIILMSKELKYENVSWTNLQLLKHHSLINKVSAAPMVRASDPVMRKYWTSHFNIPTVYTEMITIADIFNTNNDPTKSPQEILENFYYSDEATSSFRRLSFGLDELKKVNHLSIQIAIPHESENALFFWGKNGENIARTMRMSLSVIFQMVPKAFHSKIRFAINMCCPAASIEKMGAGFGLRFKPEYIDYIISTIKKEHPNLFIEFKTLMLSESDKLVFDNNEKKIEECSEEISFLKNKNLCEGLSSLNASSLIWQGKPRNKEVYDLKKVLDITNASEVKNHFKFGFSGMVAALHDKDLLSIGYQTPGNPHYSVEGILKNVTDKDNMEIMLGRILLGSAWLLLGRYANDQEILLMSLLQGLMLAEFSIGFGACGIDLMQVQLLYNFRHIIDHDLRNNLMSQIVEERSAFKMINIIKKAYSLLEKDNEIHLLKPFILRLKSAIEFATDGQINFYSEREKEILESVKSKALIIKK